MTDRARAPLFVSPAAKAIAAHGDQRTAWGSLWQEGETFWDLGQAHPSLPKLLGHAHAATGFTPEGRQIYVPGCGGGHEAAWMAGQGGLVDAADYSPEAIAAARARYPETERLKFSVQDALVCPPTNAGCYDAIIDRAMLCAIDPSDRRRYLEACAARLRPGGVFSSLAFELVHVDVGPPFPLSREQLAELCGPELELVHVESQPAAGMTEFIRTELLAVLRRR